VTGPVVPIPTELTRPYWAAAAIRELHIQRCRGCRRYVHLPEPACPWCGSAELTFERVSGRGRVATVSVIHRSFLPGFSPPYSIAWIELDEQPGLRVFGNIVGAPPDPVAIGDPVEVVFEDRDGFGSMPMFRLRRLVA
jgi:uncharacterized OB-fold protein